MRHIDPLPRRGDAAPVNVQPLRVGERASLLRLLCHFYLFIFLNIFSGIATEEKNKKNKKVLTTREASSLPEASNNGSCLKIEREPLCVKWYYRVISSRAPGSGTILAAASQDLHSDV